MLRLAEPPNLLIQDNANQVDKPYERSEEEENDGEYDTQNVLCFKAAKKSVNRPYNVE